MSETKLLKTDSPSRNGDTVSKQPDRLLSWFSDNRWYLAVAIVVLMIARSEAKRSETPAMQRNRQSIEEMSRVERDRLRHGQYALTCCANRVGYLTTWASCSKSCRP